MVPPYTNEDAEALAAQYLCGALPPGEAAQLEAALQQDDAFARELARHLKELKVVAERLLSEMEPVPPAASLRERVLAAARAEPGPFAGPRPAAAPRQIWRFWQSDQRLNDLHLLRSEEGVWQETGYPGVQVRRLFVDRGADHMTALFRLAPGASYPGHRHAGPEECLVLEGSFEVDGVKMKAGDFQRQPHGSCHGVTRSAEGCLLLISGSLQDTLR